MIYPLSAAFSFGVEKNGDSRRLVLYKDDQEFVCRKERLKKLREWIELESGSLFKGRLQLKKANAILYIQVRGETAGSMTVEEFQQLLLA